MDKFISATIDDVIQFCEEGWYNYIVVGSGMGGGTLIRSLLGEDESSMEESSKKPGDRNSREELSMDNSKLYETMKDGVSAVTNNSWKYVGGPVHCLGGRSILWALYTPYIEEEQAKKYFPYDIYSYLFSFDKEGYNKAYKLMSNDTSLDKPYPLNKDYYAQDINNMIKKLNDIPPSPDIERFPFTCCPAGVSYREPGDRLYQIPTGAFSSVTWILDRLYNKCENLTVLTQTQVMAINKIEVANNKVKVDSITVRDHLGNHRRIPTRNAKVILSAGTIDTAAIALRSGIKVRKEDLVGKGLTDHDLWGTRFKFILGENPGALSNQILRLQSWVRFKDCQDLVLVNITLNCSSFLGPVNEKSVPTLYFDKDGKPLTEDKFESTIGKCSSKSVPTTTITVAYQFCEELSDKNRVLNMPEPKPTIRIEHRDDNSMFIPHMQKLALDIKGALEDYWGIPHRREVVPSLSRADFGVVAHEVGTMRMDSPGKVGVVDMNLKVHGWDDLYVCDLSVFPVSPATNPSLTLVALAQRLGKYLSLPVPRSILSRSYFSG